MGNVIIGGSGTDTLVGGKRTVAGTAAQRGLGKVDPRLVAIIDAAAARSPYDVQIFSGKRAGLSAKSRHNSGNAVDIVLIDPNTGERIPNLRSAEAFPIYEQFAKTFREEQQSLYPELSDDVRWGGGFRQGVAFDLMHFDIKPGGQMAYWDWETGLNAEGRAALARVGNAKIYADGQERGAPAGKRYVSLWGRGDLIEPPQDAQSAIASLIAPSGGSAVPEAPTAAMGFAPTIPQAGFDAPAPVQTASAPPMPQMPPQWAQSGGFPMDEALTGASAQDVLAAGPRLDPRRSPPASGPMPPDMGAMVSPADVLAAGPNLRPGGAPDASMVPTPGISPMRPAVGGPNDRRPQPPTPPSRAQGIPDPRIRPDPASLPQRGFPAVFGEQPPPALDGMSAAMGGPPAPPAPPSGDMLGPGNAAGRSRFDNFQAMQDMADRDAQFASDQQSRMLAGDLGFQRKQMERYIPEYRAPSPQSMGERFDTAAPFPNAEQMFGLPPMNGASFPAPPPVVGTAEAGSTTGEFFTPAPPMPSPPPDPMAGRFDDAFSPGGPGMIADLQGAFNRQQAAPPPSLTAQDGINSVFGAPPAPAAVPNIAIPFAEVPTGPPMPSMAPPAPISQQQFDDRFGGGSVVRPPTPVPGQPGVVAGEMQTPAGAMDIRSPAQGGPGLPPAPAALPQASPSPPPRQPNPAAERQRNSIVGRVLGGLLGGPLGALGGGLLGGGNGGGFGFGTASFTPYGNPIMNTGMGSFRTSGTSPYGTNGSTNWKSGQSNAAGGANALAYTDSKGRPLTVVQDNWTGTYYGPTTVGGGLY